jgi:carbon monoxide dehydrogenase subunit G
MRAVMCALASLSLSLPAIAQTPDEPLVQTEEPGTIVTRLLVPAPVHEVQAILDDPYTFVAFTPDVQSMDVQTRGRCKLLRFQSRGLFESLHYSTQRCPSASGWRETLLESDSFTRYDADIALLPEGDGTQIVYRLSVGIDLPVPDVVISKNVKRSARLTMQALSDMLVRRQQTPAVQDADQDQAGEPDPLH